MTELFDTFSEMKLSNPYAAIVMSPQTRRRREEVILGDCMEELGHLGSNSIDLVLTDPPYGLASPTTIYRQRDSRFGKSTDISAKFAWDRRPDLWWVKECIRILRPGGVFISFYDRERLQEIVEVGSACGADLRDIGAWHKTNPVPQVRKVKWASALELFVILIKRGARHTFNWRLGYQHNVLVAPICAGRERTAHPTQKPLRVIRPMIAYWSRPGDVVLDPFAGSGTTAVAAREQDRDFVVIEREAAYHEFILQRLALQPLARWCNKKNCRRREEHLFDTFSRTEKTAL